MMKRLIVWSVWLLILPACAEARPNKAEQNVPPMSDAELAELVPDFVDAQSMPWLEGQWGTIGSSVFATGACSEGGLLTIKVSGYVFDVVSLPEPGHDGSTLVQGTVNVSKGAEPGFFNLTPPDWEDAYFRLNPQSKNNLTAHLYEFVPERTEWVETEQMEWERCES